MQIIDVELQVSNVDDLYNRLNTPELVMVKITLAKVD